MRKFQCLKAVFLEKNFADIGRESFIAFDRFCLSRMQYLENVHIYNFDVLIAVDKQVKKREIGKQLTTKMTGWLKEPKKKRSASARKQAGRKKTVQFAHEKTT